MGVDISLVQVTADDHGLGEVASEAGFRARERRVHCCERRERRLDSTVIAKAGQTVAAPPCQMRIVQEDKRQRRVSGVARLPRQDAYGIPGPRLRWTMPPPRWSVARL